MINDMNNLREFACHTTVILAQPRGSRLRADVVYVDRRASPGIAGHPRKSISTHGALLARGTPFELLHRRWKLQKKLKKGPVASPDLVTFPLPGALASLEEYKNRTICSIFWSPCVFDNWTQNLSHVYSKKTRKRPKILQISNFLACSC